MFKLILPCFVGLLIFCLASCANDSQQLLVNTWRGKKLTNPKMEQQIATAKIDIDTFGNLDLELQKQINIDSFKKVRQQLLELDILEQQNALQNLTYTFNKNKIVYIKDGEMVDSALWSIENKDELIIDGPALTGLGDVQKFTIKNINAQKLELQMVYQLDTSVMELEVVK